MSRTDARSRRLRRRASRTVPATIVAAVLLAVGVLGAIATIERLVSGAWAAAVSGPARALTALTWASSGVLVVAALTLLVGLVLLVAGLKPGAYRSTRLQGPSGGAVGQTEYVITDGAVARLAAARADLVDGVDKVSASAGGRRVRLRITTTSEKLTEIHDRVVSGVTDALSTAGLDPVPRVSATVTTKDL